MAADRLAVARIPRYRRPTVLFEQYIAAAVVPAAPQGAPAGVRMLGRRPSFTADPRNAV